jgi:hypothetical protein
VGGEGEGRVSGKGGGGGSGVKWPKLCMHIWIIKEKKGMVKKRKKNREDEKRKEAEMQRS